ncbi:1,6-anhydro-N-acetylmuramyl-L-alanine amidase AmpD [Acidovorax sp. SUPP2825]|uniref:1,6-anhydro-N-acetylmuramyl-L-alanine amidase AmpD n=1 Tax=Acidovorax sp. SUPP2825 TaxID=2920879 RepID=UPI0023DE4E48|nr:1,6-anhydro-N-acetylmuramyl-L-alanine amidase AmpD [Acidovorax sp. SUPP2825]GKS92974.1 1,6-anhydro-N-acetylmuramyl-L-alanine amidase AmpD [Acidovorax sp. SUPP2825]
MTTANEAPHPGPVPCPEAGDRPVWDDGWYRDATREPSPNFGPRPAQAVIDLIVVHSISLPPGEYGGGQVHRLFTNTLDWDAHPYYAGIRGLQVSAHFFIERDGRLWQFVDCDLRAWHAGPSSYRGRANCNDDSIGIELEGLEGQTFEPAQYATLARLCADLPLRYPIAHVAGHEDVAPGRKQDPGPGFDWLRLRADLPWPPDVFPLKSTRPPP